MSNTTLTADIIAQEAVMVLENNLVMANLVFRGYQEEFDKKINGYEVGDTISIRRPTDFTVRSGATAAVQDVVEGKTTIVVDQQKGIDFKFTSSDLTLKIGQLSERVIKPAMIQLGNQIDRDLMALYKKVPRHVTLTTAMNSFAQFALAPTLMDKCSIPQDDRMAVLSPASTWAMLGSQTALYIQDPAKDAYRNAKLGMIGGIDTYMSQNIPTHTTGSRDGTDTVGAAFIGDTWASTRTSNTSTITISNMSGATVTLTEGDIITIANVNDVNPVTKADLGFLKQFVVTAAYTASGSSIASVVVSPAIIPSGAQQTVAFTGGTTDLNTKVVTYLGTASTGFTQDLFFHKNAFALVTVPMVSPPGAVDVGRRTYKGISVRVIPYYDGTGDVSNWRLDVLYGVKAIDPRLAVRASTMANVP